MAVEGAREANNPGIVGTIAKEAKIHETTREIVIVGDFNEHIELDGHEDMNGRQLLTLAEQLGLDVTNLSATCESSTHGFIGAAARA